MSMSSTGVLVLVTLLATAAAGGAAQGSHAAYQQQQQQKMPCSTHMHAAASSSSIVSRLKVSTARRLLQKKYQMSPDPDNKGCYLYRGVSGDTIDDIAKALGVAAAEIRERNANNIADFSKLNGRFVQVCNIKNMDAVEGVGGGPVSSGAQTRLSAANPPPAPAPAPAPASTPKPEPAPAPEPKAAPAPEPKAAPAPEAKPTPAPGPARAGGNTIPIGGVIPFVGGGGVGLPIGIGRRHL